MGQISEYLKHLIIRTPFEEPLLQLRNAMGTLGKDPKLKEVYLEPKRLEKFMRKVLKKSSNCIDVGAHLGSFLSLIYRISPEGRHMAFEPVPQKAEWLKEKFPEVEVFQMALSDREGDAGFFVNPEDTAISSLKLKDKQNFTRIPVKQVPLDKMVSSAYPINFIKIDVEGGELQVLKGAQSILKRDKPFLIFECTEKGLSDFGNSPQEIYHFLTKENFYKVFLAKDFLDHGHPLTEDQFIEAMKYPFKAINFIAVP